MTKNCSRAFMKLTTSSILLISLKNNPQLSFFCLDTIDVARRKLNVAQYHSDLTTDYENSPEGKGKRMKIPKSFFSSDEECNNEVVPMGSQAYCSEPSTSSALPRRSPPKAHNFLSNSSLDKIRSLSKNKKSASGFSSKTTVSRQLEKSFNSSKKALSPAASSSTGNLISVHSIRNYCFEPVVFPNTVVCSY